MPARDLSFGDSSECNPIAFQSKSFRSFKKSSVVLAFQSSKSFRSFNKSEGLRSCGFHFPAGLPADI